jgi:hypothetical protein
MRGIAVPEFLAWATQYEEGRMAGRSPRRQECWRSEPCGLGRIDDYSSSAYSAGYAPGDGAKQ